MHASSLRRALLALCAASGVAFPAVAGEFGRAFRVLAAPLKAAQRQPPPPGIDPCIEDLGARIAWLEAHIDAYGSIVAKQPDVWGQSRLTRHRVEYEEQMRRQLGMFTERTSAAIRRSDQAFLGMAFAVQSASGRRRGGDAVPVPEVASSTSVINTIQGLLPTTNEAAGRADPVVIARTAPFAAVPNQAMLPFDAEPLGLEPTVHLDQMSRYLHHLAQLRRINEGDDSADAPGYALNLVRIPVSILPGKHTRKGHGAEITVIAEPLLGEDLLPVTFRSLVINDLVDMIAPALTWCVNDPECIAWAATITGAAPGPAEPAAADAGVMAALEGLRAKLPTVAPSAPPGVKTRRSRLPIPVTQLADVAGTAQIAILIRDTRAALASHPANDPCIGYIDVRGHLAEELEAAWDFLALDCRRHVWDELPAWNLAALVRGRQVRDIAAIRCRFFAAVGAGDETGPELIPALPGAAPGDVCCAVQPAGPPLCRTTTAVLAWGILVESTLLDERLAADLREAATARGHAAPAEPRPPFFGPAPAPEARAAFADYVRCRWPIRVFALDPVSEEQNVDDAHARRRELQIAMATAAATGRLSAQAMARFTRRLEQDMAVIALNKTAVGFSHGSDTFGWRFYPRMQTPPTRGGLAALGETVCGPTSDGDLMQRQLEPGQRECTAIVVMPAFVPWVTLDVRTNWFALAHPKATDPGIQQTLVLSRAVKAMQSSAAACSRCAHRYRDGEIPRLLRRVDQLERELPLQTLQAQIPHENTAGGFELFNAGVTDLAPELLGWYGAPGIDPASGTTLFLVGRGFSVHDTAVIAGGRPARFTLLSREVLRVDVPAGVATLLPPAIPADGLGAVRRPPLVLASAAEPLPAPGLAPACRGCGPADGCGTDCNRREVVDIHLATPYGVSGHLLVPVAGRGAASPAGRPAFDRPCTIGLSFAATRAATPTAKVDEFFTATCDAIAIVMPDSFIPPAKAGLRVVLQDAATGSTAASFTFPELFFDARHGRYLLAGGDLRNFIGDTSRPASDKTLRGAVKPYLDSLVQQGGLADEGDTVALTLTAAIVSGEHEVPVGGELAVTVTRRGKAAAEPAAEAEVTSP